MLCSVSLNEWITSKKKYLEVRDRYKTHTHTQNAHIHLECVIFGLIIVALRISTWFLKMWLKSPNQTKPRWKKHQIWTTTIESHYKPATNSSETHLLLLFFFLLIILNKRVFRIALFFIRIKPIWGLDLTKHRKVSNVQRIRATTSTFKSNWNSDFSFKNKPSMA